MTLFDPATVTLFFAARQIMLMALGALEDYMIIKGLMTEDKKSVVPRRKRETSL